MEFIGGGVRVGIDETVHMELVEQISAIPYTLRSSIDAASIASKLFEKHQHRSPDDIARRIALHCSSLGYRCLEE